MIIDMPTMRRSGPATVALLLCAALALPACSGRREAEEAEQRKQLLKPPDIRAKRDERRRERQLFDDEGHVLPSETKVAGLVMPKGLKQYRTFEREWYFQSREVGSEKFVEYFKRRLMPEAIERSKVGSVTFRKARIRANPDEPVVDVHVDPLKGAANAATVYVRQASPAPTKYKSGTEAEAQLEALRKYAD